MGNALFTTPDSNSILIILNQRSFPREWTSGVQCAEANPYAMQHISVKMSSTRKLYKMKDARWAHNHGFWGGEKMECLFYSLNTFLNPNSMKYNVALLVQQLPSPLYNIHGHNADIGIIGFSPE